VPANQQSSQNLDTIPTADFNRRRLEAILRSIPLTPELQDKIKAYVDNIEANIQLINNKNSLDTMQEALKQVRDYARAIYEETRFYDSSLPNTAQKLILELIKPCDEALGDFVEPVIENSQLVQNIESLHEQQENTRSTYALKNHLKQLKQYFSDERKSSVRCYIVHATPTRSNAAKEKWGKSFLMTLYEHLAEAGIRVVMDINDLRVGDSTYRFISNYTDGSRIILAGTKSLNDHHLEIDGDNAVQTSISTISKIQNKKLIYPLLISGKFDTAFPQVFNFDSKASIQSNDYLKLLENLIGWIYQDRIHNQQQYNYIWNEFYTNPNLESGISLIEAIKTYDERALLAAINQNNVNLNQEYDLSAEEIKYMTDKLTKLNGRISDLRLTQKLTPLFIAILYDNRKAYGILREKGANVFAKTASRTSLYAFITIFGSNPSDNQALAIQFPEMTLDRTIPVIIEQPQLLPMT
jgi:hypothetical protein